MDPSQSKLHELSFYTLSHPDQKYFIHQHVVDAFHAQTADANTKPVTLIYALVGLYLFIEKSYTGREVQLAHMALSKNKMEWPELILPEGRGLITAEHVLEKEPGELRDQAIKKWCASVWEAFNQDHATIAAWTSRELKLR